MPTDKRCTNASHLTGPNMVRLLTSVFFISHHGVEKY